jgi:hypothetical protein
MSFSLSILAVDSFVFQISEFSFRCGSGRFSYKIVYKHGSGGPNLWW